MQAGRTLQLKLQRRLRKWAETGKFPSSGWQDMEKGKQLARVFTLSLQQEFFCVAEAAPPHQEESALVEREQTFSPFFNKE